MDENLILARDVITANRYAMIKSRPVNQRLKLETLEADEEGNLWCWAGEDELNTLNKLENESVRLKYSDKKNGRCMIASGTFTIMNFLSPEVAGCFCKNTSGYLCKVNVQFYEYFEKRKPAPKAGVFELFKKHSLELVQSFSNIGFRKKSLVYGEAAAGHRAAV